MKGNLKGKPSKAKSVRQSARRSTVPAPSEEEQSANSGICQENGGNSSIEHGAMRRVKEEDIEAWLTTRLKELTSDETIDSKASWASSGLDSVTVVNLSAELGNWLGCVVPPAAFFQYDSPFALAHAPGILEGNIALSQGESEGVTVRPTCAAVTYRNQVSRLLGMSYGLLTASLIFNYLITCTSLALLVS